MPREQKAEDRRIEKEQERREKEQERRERQAEFHKMSQQIDGVKNMVKKSLERRSTSIWAKIGGAIAGCIPFVGSALKSVIDTGSEIVENVVETATEVIDAGRQVYETGKEIYDTGKEIYDTGKQMVDEANGAINDAKGWVNDGKAIYEQGKKIIETGKAFIDGRTNETITAQQPARVPENRDLELSVNYARQELQAVQSFIKTQNTYRAKSIIWPNRDADQAEMLKKKIREKIRQLKDCAEKKADLKSLVDKIDEKMEKEWAKLDKLKEFEAAVNDVIEPMVKDGLQAVNQIANVLHKKQGAALDVASWQMAKHLRTLKKTIRGKSLIIFLAEIILN